MTPYPETPMNAFAKFCKDHHAVPCDGRTGLPDLAAASDEALLAWVEADCKAWDANPADRKYLADRMYDAAVEVQYRRMKQTDAGIDSTVAGFRPWSSVFNRLTTERIGRYLEALTAAGVRAGKFTDAYKG